MGKPSDPFLAELESLLPAARAFAIGLAKSVADAEDVLQDSLLRACRFRDQYTPGTNMKAWLYMIIRNTFLSLIRKRRREVSLEVEGDEPRHEADQEWRARHRDLLKALEALPSYYREALLLVVVHDLSYEEAALAADCSVGTIKSRVFRARSLLAGLLDTQRPILRSKPPVTTDARDWAAAGA
ncbi:sigma-70 family RNA polymerase sigma factor [Caulobacter sp. 73W]|uniref:Sigma-70 family RNA polymerase sigma factor n=1 Tax=Caulobacter sp. 73W TaxID=3161137 RepID=A0AB39KYA3_9CAUL